MGVEVDLLLVGVKSSEKVLEAKDAILEEVPVALASRARLSWQSYLSYWDTVKVQFIARAGL